MIDIELETADLLGTLLAHPVYMRLTSVRNLRAFMTNHVFAVWDFMTLLKALQQRLTCVATPWVPPHDPLSARLINEIVLAEESDEIAPGVYLDHFSLYLTAMHEVGADTAPIDQLIAAVRVGATTEAILATPRIPESTRGFVRLNLAQVTRPTHELAATFLYGRENLIAPMFTRILMALDESELKSDALRRYLNRHITVDAEQHGPNARKLLAAVCHDDPDLWRGAVIAAREALVARIALWDGVLTGLD